MPIKQPSNATELRIAKEQSIGVLPSSPVWHEGEPNSYSDFGGELTLVARNPINAGRQRKKGVITDLDASGGFNQDLTFNNLSFLWPGVLLSARQEQPKFGGLFGDTIDDVDGTTDDAFDATGIDAAGFVVGHLILASGFGETANNGLHVVTTVATDTVEVASALTDETPPADATIQVVGFEMGTGEADFAAASGSIGPRLVRASGTIDFTDFNLLPGQFVYIGGDATVNQFTAAHNNGWFRIKSVTATAIEFDKSSGGANGTTEPVNETGTGKAIRVFIGDNTRNVSTLSAEYDPATYHLERALGKIDPVNFPAAIQSEIVKGAMLNEFSLNIAQADKITIDYTFIGIDNEQRDGLTAVQRGSGVDELRLSDNVGGVAVRAEATAYNTSSDFSRIRLATVNAVSDTAPTPLFAYATEVTLSITNNATPDKAIGRLGAFDITPGTIEIGGSMEVYFGDVNATKAVRNNADVTLDMAIVKDFVENGVSRKAGIVFDIPLIALGDGRLNVEQDQPIKLPLAIEAAEGSTGHTIMICEFPYLPESADDEI